MMYLEIVFSRDFDPAIIANLNCKRRGNTITAREPKTKCWLLFALLIRSLATRRLFFGRQRMRAKKRHRAKHRAVGKNRHH